MRPYRVDLRDLILAVYPGERERHVLALRRDLPYPRPHSNGWSRKTGKNSIISFQISKRGNQDTWNFSSEV